MTQAELQVLQNIVQGYQDQLILRNVSDDYIQTYQANQAQTPMSQGTDDYALYMAKQIYDNSNIDSLSINSSGSLDSDQN